MVHFSSASCCEVAVLMGQVSTRPSQYGSRSGGNYIAGESSSECFSLLLQRVRIIGGWHYDMAGAPTQLRHSHEQCRRCCRSHCVLQHFCLHSRLLTTTPLSHSLGRLCVCNGAQTCVCAGYVLPALLPSKHVKLCVLLRHSASLVGGLASCATSTVRTSRLLICSLL